MESMDSLASVGKPLTPTAGTEQVASPEVLEQLEQIQAELLEQVVRAASKGETFDNAEPAVCIVGGPWRPSADLRPCEIRAIR